MIPIQATCFASSAEIKATVEELLQKFFFPNKNYKSFAVSIQKRICNNVKKPEIIDMIAGRILDSDKKYKVSLDNPDATIVVEVVRTLCGIAVVPSTKTEMKHFNLLNARQKASPTEGEWANDDMHVIGKQNGMSDDRFHWARRILDGGLRCSFALYIPRTYWNAEWIFSLVDWSWRRINVIAKRS